MLNKQTIDLNLAEINFLVHVFGGQSRVADLLNVNRSSVSRWLKNELPLGKNQILVTALVLVLQRLASIYEPDTAKKWLDGTNAFLYNQTPIELLKQNRITEVLSAIEQTELGSYA